MADEDDQPRRRRRGRQLTQDELELWRRSMRDATPLHPNKPATVAPGPEPPKPPQPQTRSAPPSPRRPRATPPSPSRPKPTPPLRAGEFAGVDRRTADRLRRGRLAIDARLDLHGMTRAAAQDALVRFVDSASARDLRCVLVITGKGTFSEDGGVLRRELPRWLNFPELRRKVVAFTEAQPQHGGAGAVYILLRRRRE